MGNALPLQRIVKIKIPFPLHKRLKMLTLLSLLFKILASFRYFLKIVMRYGCKLFFH